MRKKRFSIAGAITPIAMIMIFVSLSHAEVMIKQKVHTDSFEVMGQKQPARDEMNVIWLGQGMARMDQADTSSWIFFADKKSHIELNHSNKTYMEIPVAEGEDPMSKAMKGKTNPADESKMADMMKALMKVEVKVTPTDETKKIGDWNCRKYLVETRMGMGTSTSETWATEDIKADYELFNTISKAFMSTMPGYQDILNEMKKIEGFVVYTSGTADMMGSQMKTTTEMVEYKDEPAPKGIFEIPADYKMVQPK